jgi:hypothetical protein
MLGLPSVIKRRETKHPRCLRIHRHAHSFNLGRAINLKLSTLYAAAPRAIKSKGSVSGLFQRLHIRVAEAKVMADLVNHYMAHDAG